MTAVHLVWIGVEVADRRDVQHEPAERHDTTRRKDLRIARRAQSRCRCGSGEPSPGADVAAVSPVPMQMWQACRSMKVNLSRMNCGMVRTRAMPIATCLRTRARRVRLSGVYHGRSHSSSAGLNAAATRPTAPRRPCPARNRLTPAAPRRPSASSSAAGCLAAAARR